MTKLTKKSPPRQSTLAKGARKLPQAHLSIRVPWHDASWDGTVCRNPRANTSCTILKNVGENKRDDREAPNAGKHLHLLPTNDLPPCVGERVAFMSKTQLARSMNHPYASFDKQYAHFKPTRFVQEPYSAACVPFRWMLTGEVAGDDEGKKVGIAPALMLDFQPEREPELKHGKTWVQQAENQLVLLDTFFGAIEPETSLCFFYAKRTPLSESTQRVLIGIGRVKAVGPHVEYEYEGGKAGDRHRSVLWERNVFHSIREDFSDGFLLPYQQLLALADDDADLRVEDYVVFVPDELRPQFSYGNEHVSHDAAISTLIACAERLRKLAERVPGPWEKCLVWIDAELNRLWKARGPFPGIGSVLCAFGLKHGNLVGHAINSAQTSAKREWREDPWQLVDAVFDDPTVIGDVGKLIGATFQKKWKGLPPQRRRLLELLARCEVTADQAERFWEATTRKAKGIELSDAELIQNLYRAFEEDRRSIDAVSFGVIDRGLFPAAIVAKDFPLPAESALADAIDPRRVRALTIDTLELAAGEGHTLLPRSWVVERVRARPMDPPCPLDEDTLAVTEDVFTPLVHAVSIGKDERAFQLDRFVDTRQVVATGIQKRLKGKRHVGSHDWARLLDEALPSLPDEASKLAVERRARDEKSASLAELFASRASVLIGPAGTGKTTLLRVLCDLPEVRDGGVLLLAPTGKARVRLETQTKLVGKGKTIAQFLLGFGRYDGATGRYFVNPNAARCGAYGTVIVDEASMLTEEQLAALMDGLEKVARLILVGDPRQLPPIGAGRPFVDVVRELKPTDIEARFPRCGAGYAELTVPCRHDANRDDVLLAAAFAGQPLDPGHDEVWGRVLAGTASGVSFVRWSDAGEVLDKLATALLERLPKDHEDPGARFECSLGGSVHQGHVYFWPGRDGQEGAAAKSSDWQVLSPLRGALAGTDALNRGLQLRFRDKALKMSTPEVFYNRRVPPPQGPQGILWGDKVINTQNKARRRVWPKRKDAYVANGDTGIVVGQFKTKAFPGLPSNLEVEFAGQGSFRYTYWPSEFSGEDGNPPLELAYALTVHKTQGSEFGTTYLVLPNPCRLLSRELLYTALTRHQNELVVLHQGDLGDIRAYADESRSEIASRMTNLFRAPHPVEVTVQKEKRFLEDGLIHRTLKGDLVRSKSELYIADTLHRAGKRYLYEERVALKGGDRYPDFTLHDDEAGVTFYWEHLGLLGDPSYRARWERKLKAYRDSGVLPHAEGGGPNGTLIVTRDDENGGLDGAAIDRIVREVLA